MIDKQLAAKSMNGKRIVYSDMVSENPRKYIWNLKLNVTDK